MSRVACASIWVQEFECIFLNASCLGEMPIAMLQPPFMCEQAAYGPNSRGRGGVSPRRPSGAKVFFQPQPLCYPAQQPVYQRQFFTHAHGQARHTFSGQGDHCCDGMITAGVACRVLHAQAFRFRSQVFNCVLACLYNNTQSKLALLNRNAAAHANCHVAASIHVRAGGLRTKFSRGGGWVSPRCPKSARVFAPAPAALLRGSAASVPHAVFHPRAWGMMFIQILPNSWHHLPGQPRVRLTQPRFTAVRARRQATDSQNQA